MDRRSDALRRGVRTFIDVAFVGAMLELLAAFDVDFTDRQHSALMVVGTFVVSALKNAAEDRGTVPALLKAEPSRGADPVPDPED